MNFFTFFFMAVFFLESFSYFTWLVTINFLFYQARRIFKLMNDHRHEISAYSWSILVDIHAKLGDFESCVNVLQEMAAEGVPPTQAAYTSLMAACHKVCNNGRPNTLRLNQKMSSAIKLWLRNCTLGFKSGT